MKGSIPNISPYGTFQGSLFQYTTPFPSLVAFESCPPLDPNMDSSGLDVDLLPTKKCILLGGLSDGLIPTPYSKPLESACHNQGWSLVQPVLSSSYLGFGNGSLERDSTEIGKLLQYLRYHRNGETFAIVGHSTGCQNAVHFMKHGDADLRDQIKFIALQAPVSDREGAMTEKNYESAIKHARELKSQGKENEMMPRNAFWAPITASRFLSLQDMGGEDDFFSSDLTDKEMQHKLSHIGDHKHGLTLLAAFSGKDEYVPSHVDKVQLLDRLCTAMNFNCELNHISNVAVPLMLETGNHNLSNEETDAEKFIEAIENQIKLL